MEINKLNSPHQESNSSLAVKLMFRFGLHLDDDESRISVSHISVSP